MFGSVIRAHGGIGPGFDLTRLILASGVVLWHSFGLTEGGIDRIANTPFWLLISAMVPMFFAVSGFLVTASALRVPSGAFVLNRIARIYPGLVAVILIWACLFGPMLSTLSPGDYVRDPLFARYLLGLIGYIQYELPGLFAANPYGPAVNGSLWTVPWELLCYAMMAALMIVGVAGRAWVAALLLVALLIAAALPLALGRGALPSPAEDLLWWPRFVEGAKVVPYFFLGSLAFLLRDRIPQDGRLAFACFLLILLVGAVGDFAWASAPLLWLLAGPPMVYLAIWLGLTRLPMPRLLLGNDLSYGVYLWHFPILQTLLFVLGIKSWWVLFLLAIPPVLLAAVMSWVLVERPALKLRRRHSLAGRRAAEAEQPAAAPSVDSVRGTP
jgi:peptidoglycan/LPS O-acetylase OafA/YrhL